MKTLQKALLALTLVTQFPLSISAQEKDQQAWEKSPLSKFESRNLPLSQSDTVDFQISWIPFIGTNGLHSGNVVNRVSFNVLGGYSAGTASVELSGLFAVNRGNMQGVQLSGWFNHVGQAVDGVQLAGLFNSNLDQVKGVQLAGLGNFTIGEVDGIQLAGVMNFSPKSVSGAQISGVLNFAGGEVEGMQLAGVGNFAAKNIKGSQLSLVNFARKVDGFQLGLINYADSVGGVPVGLISIVKNGYLAVEVGATEILPLNLTIRSGKREFYTMLFAGIRPEIRSQAIWSFGYGVGTSPRLGQKTFLNIEGSTEQLSKGEVEALNLISRLYVGGEWQLAKGMAIYAGPTLNFRVYEAGYAGHPELFTYTQHKVRNERSYPDDIRSHWWTGFKAGFRFF